MHAPHLVHTCTFFNVNVDADVNVVSSLLKNIHRGAWLSLTLTLSFSWRTKFAKKLRLAKIFKYQPHLVAGEVA